jgi:hypothetical protein
VTAEALDALGTLDRDLLYLFVAGPGQGEGIAVALPGAGWLLVDGCTTGATGEGLPLLAIVERWRASKDEPILAMVLTHPHQDHAGGFAELVEVLDPRAIALAGTDLLSAARSAFETTMSASDRGRIGAVHAAILAIDRWLEDHPGKLVALHQGAELPTEGSSASVVARAPEAGLLTAFLTEPGVRKRLKEEANHISVVLEIEHSASRVVLTGDLPRYRTGTKTAVSSGWDQVLPGRPELGNHAALKIPHHGSADAAHPVLMPADGTTERAWTVTPYNSSRLPRLADMDGLPQLVGLLPSILLTGVPVSKKIQAKQPAPGIVRIAQLVSRYASQRLGEPFLDGGVELTPGNACEPLDPIWAVAVDGAGAVVGRWRGGAALEVVP